MSQPRQKHPKFRLGSKDSKDVDVVYIFDTKPSNKECYAFCNEDPLEDRNIIVLNQEKIVSDCYYGMNCRKLNCSGTADAINNCLFLTYSLHEQESPNPISCLVNRNVPLKVAKVVRLMFSTLSRSKIGENLKGALSDYNFLNRLEQLNKVNFEQASDLSLDDLKTIGFQFAQTLGLIQGKEIYSKAEACQLFGDLKDILYRTKTELKVLNKYKELLYSEISKIQIFTEGPLNLFWCDKPSANNWFLLQCHGLIINMKNEECLLFPLSHQTKEYPSWPNDVLTSQMHDRQNLIAPFIFQNKLRFSSCSEIIPEKSPIHREVIELFSEYQTLCNFSDNFYMFMRHEKSFNLIASRNRASLKLMFEDKDLHSKTEQT